MKKEWIDYFCEEIVFVSKQVNIIENLEPIVINVRNSSTFSFKNSPNSSIVNNQEQLNSNHNSNKPNLSDILEEDDSSSRKGKSNINLTKQSKEKVLGSEFASDQVIVISQTSPKILETKEKNDYEKEEIDESSNLLVYPIHKFSPYGESNDKTIKLAGFNLNCLDQDYERNSDITEVNADEKELIKQQFESLKSEKEEVRFRSKERDLTRFLQIKEESKFTITANEKPSFNEINQISFIRHEILPSIQAKLQQMPANENCIFNQTLTQSVETQTNEIKFHKKQIGKSTKNRMPTFRTYINPNEVQETKYKDLYIKRKKSQIC